MPTQRLKAQLEALQDTLNDPNAELTAEERESLQGMANNIYARLLVKEGDEPAEEDPTLVDGVNLMAEQFAVRHPTLAGTLRNVMQSLSDMGI
ncbi:MAG TPA: DUF4404 family protein [Pseudomonas sabulinigri]|uniref:Uncharacterized protein n=1 Tax=marine sediment metagenome TaxID=412755 RepID=A0A0F9VVK9_9ZZZZ|nr:DUF4404 family protein [Halopseudomonas sabulinigri]HEC51724.1 DUF4404 family protein [Halopseudomonas sabulinigri]|tara:strand:+ start:363 stop:641 length:279 start_codon:yes stop_codon:yes gene_type:complete